VHDRDKSGSTPLHWAVRNGHIEVAIVLIENGASLQTKDRVSVISPVLYIHIYYIQYVISCMRMFVIFMYVMCLYGCLTVW
jgi:Ankyrin repeats (many copies)